MDDKIKTIIGLFGLILLALFISPETFKNIVSNKEYLLISSVVLILIILFIWLKIKNR